MTSRNLAALKAMVRRHPITINGQTVYARGAGTIKLFERIVQHPVVLDLIEHKKVDAPTLLAQAPGFVLDIIEDSLFEEEASAALEEPSQDEPFDPAQVRAEIRKFVIDLPPDEMIAMADGVIDATMPDGIEATKKKLAPLMAKFQAKAETEAVKGKK